MTAATTMAARRYRGSHTEGRSQAELRELVQHVGAELELAPAEVIIDWAAATFGERFCVTSSMSDTALSHLASQVIPGVDVVFVDTGYHFPETLGTRDAAQVMLPITVINATPKASVTEFEAEFGRLYETDPDRCCALRKVAPLDSALAPYEAWANGIRRSETRDRVISPVIGWDAKRGKVRVSPLARWTDRQLNDYLTRHQLLLNPLLLDGYGSVGCRHCTRRTPAGQDARAGRWLGSTKTECGINS